MRRLGFVSKPSFILHGMPKQNKWLSQNIPIRLLSQSGEWQMSKIVFSLPLSEIQSSAGAQNHIEIADIELTSKWEYEWNFPSDGFTSNAWHTQYELYSCCRSLKTKTNEWKNGYERKVEEKVAALQSTVGIFSVYQVLKTIGFVPDRLVISYHNIMWEPEEKKSTKRVIARAAFQTTWKYQCFDKKQTWTNEWRKQWNNK